MTDYGVKHTNSHISVNSVDIIGYLMNLTVLFENECDTSIIGDLPRIYRETRNLSL